MIHTTNRKLLKVVKSILRIFNSPRSLLTRFSNVDAVGIRRSGNGEVSCRSVLSNRSKVIKCFDTCKLMI